MNVKLQCCTYWWNLAYTAQKVIFLFSHYFSAKERRRGALLLWIFGIPWMNFSWIIS